MVVALVVAHLVPREPLALHVRAGARPGQVVLAVAPREVQGAVAAVLGRVGRVVDARAAVLTRQQAPMADLAVRPTEARRTLAAQLAHCRLHAAAAVLATQFEAVVVLDFAAAVAGEALQSET